MARTNKNHDNKKSEILNIAEELFVKKGYDKVTVRDILESSNLSKGGFYHYFPTKESVLSGVIDRIIEGIVERTEILVITKSINPLKKLKAVLQRNNNFSSNQFKSRKLLENFYHDKNKSLIYDFHIKFKNRMVPLLIKIVQEGIDEGYFEKSLYQEETVEILFMMVLCSNFLMIGKSREEISKYIYSLETIMEKALGLQDGQLTVM